jgi:hypothetical protein
MKKSEMINMLSIELLDMYPHEYMVVSKTFSEMKKEMDADARLIIDFLEKRGMLPPYSETNSEHAGPVLADAYMWEPE